MVIRRRLHAIAVAFAGLILAALTAGPALASRFVPVLGPGDIVPALALTAQDGRTFSFADLRGKALLVSFIYTRCTDARMCPLVTAKFARIARDVGAAPIRLVAITLDPGYDTPAVLRRYGRLFGQDTRVFTLATGDSSAPGEVAARLGIDSTPGRPSGIIHTEAAIVIAPDGRIAQTVFGNDWSADDLLAAARATLPGRRAGMSGTLRLWLAAALERCGGAAAPRTGTLLAIFAVTLVLCGLIFRRAFRGTAARRVVPRQTR